jgi:PA14 domain/Bacterial SH3 domain
MLKRLLLPITALLVMFVLAVPLFHARAEFGTNWTATYYNCTDFNCPAAATQTGINGINFNYGAGSPISGVNADNFTIRFESVQVFQQGTYEFVASSDDGIRVYIDGALVLDRFIGRVLTTDRFQQTLTAGSHTLRVEYLETIDQGQVQFQYFLVSAAAPTQTPVGGVVVPPISGTPGVVGTPSGPAATVVRVNGLAVRTGPYIGASFVTTAIGQSSYPVIARNRSEGLFTWYLIDVNGRRGWASGRYLELTVDPNSLPLQNTIFDEIDGAPDTGIIGATRSVMNVRVRPSNRVAIVDQLAWGEEVQIIGRSVQARQNHWLHIRTSEGVVGWIIADFVTVRGDSAAVPVR